MKISIDLDIEASEIPLATELLNTLRCISRVSVKFVNSQMSFCPYVYSLALWFAINDFIDLTRQEMDPFKN